MPTSDTSSPGDWASRLDPARGDETLLESLQDLAREESVAAVTLRCIELLGHDASEIRLWANEALESAVQPGSDETKPLTQRLADLLDDQAAGEAQPATSLLADRMYWAATMIGRIGNDATSARPTLARLEALTNDPQATAFHAAAARAGRVLGALPD